MTFSQAAGNIFWLCLASGALFGQTFNSGSTGVDGALIYTTPGNYVFDPKAAPTPIDQDGDGIFNFTTINIAAGVNLRLAGDVYSVPVIWLAQGTVVINGTIDASGQNGFAAGNTTQRILTIPGSGGYGGGYPAIGNNPAGVGLGPGAGKLNADGCINGGFTSNQFLVPLVGGSGGAGFFNSAGGAGGGAILIASSASISGSGSILAKGGNAGGAGSGSGGAIRLVAPSVNLTGLLNASSGALNSGCSPPAGLFNGTVRIEAFQIGAINSAGNLYTATPYALFLSPTGTPSLRVVSVGNMPVSPSPTGLFTIPDVTINSNTEVVFAIQANNIPEGTVVTLVIFSENGPDKAVQSTPLTGGFGASVATATTTLPAGFSKGFLKAIFTQ